MSIYRDIVKRRPIVDYTSFNTRRFNATMERFDRARDHEAERGRDSALASEFGSVAAAHEAFDLMGNPADYGMLDPRHGEISRSEILAATPVDITGVYPADTMDLGAIEPRPFPWRYTWLEDFDLGLGMLLKTDFGPCSCCDEQSWKVAAEIFMRSKRQTGFAGRESIRFSSAGAAPEIKDGEVLPAELLGTAFGIQSYVARLLACKNVRTEAARPARKKRKKRNPKTGIEWKVVAITKTKKSYRLGSKASSGGTRPDVRHHSVGGHFKTYTADSPLMGRHVGTFFWASFARGSRGRGEIHKVFSDRRDTPLLSDAKEAHS